MNRSPGFVEVHRRCAWVKVSRGGEWRRRGRCAVNKKTLRPAASEWIAAGRGGGEGLGHRVIFCGEIFCEF